MDDTVWWQAARDFAVPLAGGAVALLAALRTWWKRRKKWKARQFAEGDALRKLLDAVRYQMNLLTQPNELVDKAQHEHRIWQLRCDIDDVREALWLANGHRSKRRRDG